MARAICVLGMHRSGTSLVAELLESLGVYFGGEEDLLPPNYANPRGYREFRAIAETHDLLLRELSRGWDTAFPLPEEWHRRPEVQPYRDRLEEVVKATFSSHETFGWKDPRTCLTLPLWKDLMEGLGIPVHYVLVFRNPLDVANSLASRDEFEIRGGLGLWFHYNLEILTGTADQARTAVRYEDLLDRKSGEVERLSNALSLESPEKGDELLAPDIMDPGLCHSRSSEEAVRAVAPELVTSLYELILGASEGRVSRKELDERAGELYRELSRFAAVLLHDHREAAKRLEPLEERVRHLESSIEEERQRRLALEGRLRHELTMVTKQLEDSVEDRRRLAAVLAEIHDSRWWKVAQRYWSFRRWIGGSR